MPRPNRGAYLTFRPDRGGYYIHWTEHGRSRRIGTGTRDRAEAEAALARFITGRHERERPAGPRHPSTYPIGEALALYAELHAPTVKAPERIAYAIDALLPFWQDNAVADVTDDACRAYADHRARSAGTIRKELGVLRAAINYAHKRGRITTAPHVQLPTKPEGRQRWLTNEEATRLIAASRRIRTTTGKDLPSPARGHLPLFILLALFTGARKDAILSLRWPQVDLDRRQIDFNPPGRARSTKRRATVRISRRLMVLLRLARGRGTDLGYVLHQDGNRLLDVRKSFARACRDAGLESVTPHTLRHTCGTWMAQDGVDLFQIAGWLGHSNARTTELYAHHHPDHMSAALRSLDRRRK